MSNRIKSESYVDCSTGGHVGSQSGDGRTGCVVGQCGIEETGTQNGVVRGSCAGVTSKSGVTSRGW